MEGKGPSSKSDKLSEYLIQGAVKSKPSPVEGRPAPPGTAASSLYEDTFSRRDRGFPWIVVVLSALGLVVLGVLATVFLTGPADLAPALEQAAPPPEQDTTAPEGLATLPVSSVTPSPPPAAAPPQETAEVRSESTAAARMEPSVATPAKVQPETAPVATEAPSENTTPSTRRLPSREAAPTSSGNGSVGASQADVRTSTDSPRPESVPTESEKAVEALPPEPSGASVEKPGQAEYLLLLQRSAAAARLVAGGYSTLSFKDWRVVQETPKEVWLDLRAAWSNGGEEASFIWAVSREKGSIRALSQAARNLEAGSADR